MYLPLTSLSFSLNYYFSGFNPLPYHLVNILLHLVTIILVFWFIYLLSDSFVVGLITASLFALHTMQVESVAFAAGRRDILYTLFFILSCIFYVKYIDKTQDTSIKTQENSKFKIQNLKFIFFFIFILSLLSKGQAVSLPITLIILDFFRGEKFCLKNLF